MFVLKSKLGVASSWYDHLLLFIFTFVLQENKTVDTDFRLSLALHGYSQNYIIQYYRIL